MTISALSHSDLSQRACGTTLATASPALSWNVLNSTAFTTTQSGQVDITVDWHNAEANVGAFVVQAGSCTAEHFKKSSCSFAEA